MANSSICVFALVGATLFFVRSEEAVPGLRTRQLTKKLLLVVTYLMGIVGNAYSKRSDIGKKHTDHRF